MKVLFNKKTMEHTVKNCELDADKLPLGKLESSPFTTAHQVLQCLEIAVADKNHAFIVGYTNKLFTLIPHSFDLAAMPVLDSQQKIDDKKEELKALAGIVAEYDFKRNAPPDQNSFEAFYLKLNAEVLPLYPDSDEFQLIEKYARNTSAHMGIEIAKVFKVNRQGEKDRYAKYKKTSNRMLLWHGSDVTNFASIIDKGLIIKKAAANTRMFGDGIYFAEMLCKALGFCIPDEDDFSYLVLCEVALGKMKEYSSQCYVNPLPAGFQSVKGIGRTHPDPKEAHTRSDGVVVPLGQPIPTNQPFLGFFAPLNYNEYVVYNKDAVNIQYLVKLKAT